MNIYIALDEFGLDWTEKEVNSFKAYYNQGHGYRTISEYLKRSQRDVIALALDQLSIDQFRVFMGGV